jgi:glutathione S-transferase
MLVEVCDRMKFRLKDHVYIVGQTQSLADIAWLPQYVLLTMLDFDFDGYPGIVAWSKLQKQRRSCQPAIAEWLPRVPGWALRAGLIVTKAFSGRKAA